MTADSAVRLAIFRSFAETGRSPSVSELGSELELAAEEVEQALHRLAAAHALTLAPTTSNVWMAHPFSAVPTAYTVVSGETTYWANCAWDAFAIPPMLELDARVAALCPDCGESLRLRFEKGRFVEGGGVVHFAVPPRRFWENVGFT